MDIIKKIKPAVPQKVLFFIAGLVWGFAGSKILTIGFSELYKNSNLIYLNIIIGIVGFYFFFKGVFYKMYKKHTRRIINSQIEKPCIFSFFDIKGYMIMAFMITFGILLRKANIMPPVYLGTFYIALGLSLFSAGVSFIYAGIRYEYIKVKYLNVEN